MAQAQAASSRSSVVSRRGALALLLVAAVLAVAAGLSASTYITGEAQKVAAPMRSVWTASRDVAAGTLLGAADVSARSLPIPDDLRDLYFAAEGGAPPASLGLTVHALRKGQPLVAGDLLPANAATTVAPLIPPQVAVGGTQRPVAGGLNLTLDRLLAPPPAMTEHDRIDLWAYGPSPGSTGAASLQIVLEDIEILAFVGDDAGIVVAVTREQLERYLSFASSGTSMIVTVRPSPRK